MPSEPVPVLPRRSADPGALAECAAEILDKLAAAHAPAMMVDVEIRRYRVEDRVAEHGISQRGVFHLIEVILPRGVTSDTLGRFVAGFKAARERA